MCLVRSSRLSATRNGVRSEPRRSAVRKIAEGCRCRATSRATSGSEALTMWYPRDSSRLLSEPSSMASSPMSNTFCCWAPRLPDRSIISDLLTSSSGRPRWCAGEEDGPPRDTGALPSTNHSTASHERAGRRPDVVVGTPGRLLGMVQRGTPELTRVRYPVPDEADEMLHAGVAPVVERLLALTRPPRARGGRGGGQDHTIGPRPGGVALPLGARCATGSPPPAASPWAPSPRSEILSFSKQCPRDQRDVRERGNRHGHWHNQEGRVRPRLRL